MATWVDHQQSCNDLLQYMTQVFKEEFSDKRPVWTISSIDRTVDRFSSIIYRAQAVVSALTATLKQERNKFPWINSLPVEIMRTVFQLACQQDNRQVRLSISHTCSYWRDISTSDTALWTNLSLHSVSESIARLFAQRSAQRPLAIDYNACTRNCAHLDHVCSTQMHRAKILNVILPNDRRIPSFFKKPSGSGLQVLTVRNHEGTLHLDDFLANQDLPQLTKLELHNFRFSTGPRTLTSLTTLHLSCGSVTLTSVLDVLRNAPLLESILLTISHFLHEDTPAITYWSQPVHLAAAKDVCLTLADDAMRDFLAAISLPESTRYLSLILYPAPVNPADIRLCFPPDRRRIPVLKSFCAVSVVRIGRRWTLEVAGHTTRASSADSDGDGDGDGEAKSQPPLSSVSISLGISTDQPRALTAAVEIIDGLIEENVSKVDFLYLEGFARQQHTRRSASVSSITSSDNSQATDVAVTTTTTVTTTGTTTPAASTISWAAAEDFVALLLHLPDLECLCLRECHWTLLSLLASPTVLPSISPDAPLYSVQLVNMTITASDLLALCKPVSTNEGDLALFSGTKLILRDCTVRAEDEDARCRDFAALHMADVDVQVLGSVRYLMKGSTPEEYHSLRTSIPSAILLPSTSMLTVQNTD